MNITKTEKEILQLFADSKICSLDIMYNHPRVLNILRRKGWPFNREVSAGKVKRFVIHNLKKK